MAQSSPQRLCSRSCGRPVVAGYKWCQQCYNHSKNPQATSNLQGSVLSTSVTPGQANPGNLCKKCGGRPANPGRAWCQQCFIVSQNPQATNYVPQPTQTTSVQFVCPNNHIRPFNSVHQFCGTCGGLFTQRAPQPTGICSADPTHPPNPGAFCGTCGAKYNQPGPTGAGNNGNNCQCGNPLAQNSKFCTSCISNFKAQGLCTNGCGRQANQGRSWCQPCFDASKPNTTVTTPQKNPFTTTVPVTPQPTPPPPKPAQCAQACGRNANPGYQFCQQCYDTSTAGTSLQTVDQAKYASIESQFKDSMTSAKVLAIFAVYNKNQHLKYEAYKQKLGAKPNEKRWWHGSNLDCDLMNTKTCCKSSSCAICCILQSSFLLSKSSSGGRCGKGIYFAPKSDKSHTYTRTSKPYRAMVLSRVAVGKCHKVTSNHSHLTAAPSGYNSVLAEGGAFSTPECIVYDESACSPSYVLFYQ